MQRLLHKYKLIITGSQINIYKRKSTRADSAAAPDESANTESSNICS